MPAKKYYAVKVGVKPGIYTDWDTTANMVKGYSGSIYKSFKTLAEAKKFLGDEPLYVQTQDKCFTTNNQDNNKSVIVNTQEKYHETNNLINKKSHIVPTNFTKSKGDKYYAVKKGHTPGIYTDWTTASSMIKGFKGSVYKSFSTYAEAKNFLSFEDSHLDIDNATIVYTDGSYSSSDSSNAGYGIVILNKDGAIDKLYHGNVNTMKYGSTNNVAELFAIKKAISLTTGPCIVNTDSMYCVNTLGNYCKFWNKDQWNKAPNSKLLLSISKKMESRQIKLVHVSAHVGIEFNELADQLANSGRELNIGTFEQVSADLIEP